MSSGVWTLDSGVGTLGSEAVLPVVQASSSSGSTSVLGRRSSSGFAFVLGRRSPSGSEDVVSSETAADSHPASALTGTVGAAGCDSWPVMRVPALAFGVHSVNTTYGTRLSLRNDNGTSVCRLDYHFGEFGWYQLSPPKHSGSQRCSLAVVTEPANIYAREYRNL
ncbi:hypothetical protein FJT64_017096 [Amphibalanus amphitrite]|uniref:Uncharacterized protein n=1 Tax=Amphibalanus amphitrite TaxID=1232801 RepID=A0A6A4WYE6_AMPAM|nr:hypothetical protein FJT64_017096 [Amphibalanus amphitrite]